MNRTKQLIACGLALVLAAGLQACSHQTGESSTASSAKVPGSAMPANLKITSWGPDSTKAGVAFNKQPNGSAALWIRVNQSLAGDEAAVEFNGVLLQGNVVGNLVTAGVSADLYAKPGSYKVRVIARKGEHITQSNDVTFTVD